jgi:TolB protein
MMVKSEKIILLLLAMCIVQAGHAQKPLFTEAVDVGNPKMTGKMTFNKENQTYEILGSGVDIWAEKDEFFFAAKKITGDFILTAKVEILSKTGDPHRKIGLMIRQSMDARSPYAGIVQHADGLLSLQYRLKAGGTTEELKFPESGAQYLQIEKKGNKILAHIAQAEKALTAAIEIELPFENSFFVGLVACSLNSDNVVTGSFSNVRLDVPAGDHVDGYKSPSASRLEILDVESGLRKVIYSTTNHIEAPNWSRDGEFLIYNSEGKLYKFELATCNLTLINTGMAIQNNNDHGISFDGKKLAISNHTVENGTNNSIIYTLPVAGGKPKRITKKGPSYWHGWSPNGKDLVYCAERNGQYDVYQIPAKGGTEMQLTNNPGLDDGPEYSPDGKYIYFNSTRTGTMKIWRMKPDGSDQEQITFDENNDWFAHPSPDGQTLIYISYPPEVPANSHPHNQRVMLRVLPVDGKEQKVMAHIYGGQGTFNVPSWSPDSKKVAFVSYTYGDPE